MKRCQVCCWICEGSEGQQLVLTVPQPAWVTVTDMLWSFVLTVPSERKYKAHVSNSRPTGHIRPVIQLYTSHLHRNPSTFFLTQSHKHPFSRQQFFPVTVTSSCDAASVQMPLNAGFLSSKRDHNNEINISLSHFRDYYCQTRTFLVFGYDAG